MSIVPAPDPFCLPQTILRQHIAVVGKTGSGKTSTMKLIVEHVAAEGARVCGLDPIKSDLWGLSAEGTLPGLPFHILGGPRGHVPLHAEAGAAIGELVGNGSLPLSVLDMANFEMGGLQQFFVHFAPALLRHMRGVLYLVIEEAHEYAPKDRSGVGAENMAIYFAKKLATAGRSKGIRLIVATQRTQALHNAVLGSCDTLIAHRIVAPADQEPVKKWLKANLPPDKAKEVAASLQSLKTGEAWVCSGEAAIFERRQFPRIATYDNTATPTDDISTVDVKTAPVDLDRLRAIIGTALEEAKANDPKTLAKEVARLQAALEQFRTGAPVSVQAEAVTLEVPVFTPDDQAALAGINSSLTQIISSVTGTIEHLRSTTEAQIKEAQETLQGLTSKVLRLMPENSAGNIQRIPQSVATVYRAPAPIPTLNKVAIDRGPKSKLDAAERGLLAVIVYRTDSHQGTTTRDQAAVKAGYAATSGHVDNTLGALRSAGYVEGTKHGLSATHAGAVALGRYETPLQSQALVDLWLGKLNAAEKRMLAVLVKAYPKSLTRDQVATQTNYAVSSGHVDNTLGHLRSLRLISGHKHALTASAELMQP